MPSPYTNACEAEWKLLTIELISLVHRFVWMVLKTERKLLLEHFVHIVTQVFPLKGTFTPTDFNIDSRQPNLIVNNVEINLGWSVLESVSVNMAIVFVTLMCVNLFTEMLRRSWRTPWTNCSFCSAVRSSRSFQGVSPPRWTPGKDPSHCVSTEMDAKFSIYTVCCFKKKFRLRMPA